MKALVALLIILMPMSLMSAYASAYPYHAQAPITASYLGQFDYQMKGIFHIGNMDNQTLYYLTNATAKVHLVFTCDCKITFYQGQTVTFKGTMITPSELGGFAGDLYAFWVIS